MRWHLSSSPCPCVDFDTHGTEALVTGLEHECAKSLQVDWF